MPHQQVQNIKSIFYALYVVYLVHSCILVGNCLDWCTRRYPHSSRYWSQAHIQEDKNK